MLNIYHNCALEEDDKTQILALQDKIKSKVMGTDDGKERAKRIIKCFTDDGDKIQLVMAFYTYPLKKLKEYVLLFQSKVPLLHKLNDKQLVCYRDFMGYIFKSEYIIRMFEIFRFCLDFHFTVIFLQTQEIYSFIKFTLV